jgi:hypothetical protein
VYSDPIDNKETLHQRIFDARQIISNRTGTFETVRQSMIRRVSMRALIQVEDILSTCYEL